MNTEDAQRYLLLDDSGARAAQFQERISNEDLSVKIAFEARELRAIRHDLAILDGAIIDFHLETPRRPGYEHLRYPCTETDCPKLLRDEYPDLDMEAARLEHDWHATADIPEVDVTTGLGAMLYIKQHALDVPLFGYCELNATHSLLFLNAAHLWLGASAIDAGSAPDDIRDALTTGLPEDFLPINKQLAAAREPFKRLTNSLSNLTLPAEAFEWLDEYRFCGRKNTLADFERRLANRFGRKTLESNIYIQAVGTWQARLSEVLAAFNEDVTDWPDLREVNSARFWDESNPVLDFVQNRDYQTFFTAADMRAALAYYRANQRRRAAENPLGDFA